MTIVTLPLIITDPRMQHLNYCKCVLEREPRTFIHVKRANRFDPVG